VTPTKPGMLLQPDARFSTSLMKLLSCLTGLLRHKSCCKGCARTHPHLATVDKKMRAECRSKKGELVVPGCRMKCLDLQQPAGFSQWLEFAAHALSGPQEPLLLAIYRANILVSARQVTCSLCSMVL
jgi:hypothetical protein